MTRLIDGCGRRIDHLRLSVTSACNLRCLYCRPSGEDGRVVGHAPLTDGQRVECVRFLHGAFGLRQVRLTGGEPLLHRTLVPLVEAIRNATPSLDIALTTNAVGLAPTAARLRAAGLDRLNVSLDSLDPDRYHRLTGGSLSSVLKGIVGALEAGFPPPKVNMVVLRGLNDDEVVPMAEWGIRREIEIRYLEAMPIGPAATVNRQRFVAADEVRKALAARFEMTPLLRGWGSTAMRFRIQGDAGDGCIGFIAPITRPFCSQCRRIRVTADGRLYPCLLDPRSADLAPIWQHGRFCARTAHQIVTEAVAEKSPSGGGTQSTVMVRLGG